MDQEPDLWDIIFGPESIVRTYGQADCDADDDLLHVLEFFNGRAFPLAPERDTRRWTLRRRLGWDA